MNSLTYVNLLKNDCNNWEVLSIYDINNKLYKIVQKNLRVFHTCCVEYYLLRR
jgi:hypothetical protein